MFKRFLVMALCTLFLVLVSLPAETVVGAEYAFRLSNPDLLSAAASSAGGAFFSAGGGSIAVNPALTAAEQRIGLNLGYTALFEPAEDFEMGGAAQVALLVPSKWGVFSGMVDGIFCDIGELNLKNSLGVRLGFAKDITENLYAGISLGGGVRWADNTQWAASLGLGVVYSLGNLGFLQDVRFGGAVTNLGKPYEAGYPGIGTPRVGMAGTLFSVADGKVAGAFSADLSFPQFMNGVLDAGLQLKLADVVLIKSAWQFDLRENLDKHHNLIPSVGVTVKFGIDTKNNQFMADKGWQQSEITTSAAWQKLYGSIHAASVGAAINLGLKDTAAPEIILWGEN